MISDTTFIITGAAIIAACGYLVRGWTGMIVLSSAVLYLIRDLNLHKVVGSIWCCSNNDIKNEQKRRKKNQLLGKLSQYERDGYKNPWRTFSHYDSTDVLLKECTRLQLEEQRFLLSQATEAAEAAEARANAAANAAERVARQVRQQQARQAPSTPPRRIYASAEPRRAPGAPRRAPRGVLQAVPRVVRARRRFPSPPPPYVNEERVGLGRRGGGGGYKFNF